MSFQVHALEAAPEMDGAVLVIADKKPGYPCRVSLEDAEVGEAVWLVNYEHMGIDSPFRARHAIYVRQGARRAEVAVGEVPEMIAQRLLSLRAFDARGMMVRADVVEGRDAAGVIEEWFGEERVEFIDLHFAKPGCFAARARRVNVD